MKSQNVKCFKWVEDWYSYHVKTLQVSTNYFAFVKQAQNLLAACNQKEVTPTNMHVTHLLLHSVSSWSFFCGWSYIQWRTLLLAQRPNLSPPPLIW